jgi:DNA-binding LytR/AlgR family response regulator
VAIVGEADNGHEELRLIEELRPDLVSLDLRMPLMGGFEVIRLRGDILPAFIIATARDQHAIEAFEAGAIDYLLKPASQNRIQMALQRTGFAAVLEESCYRPLSFGIERIGFRITINVVDR